MILLWTRCSLCPWPTTSTLGYTPWRFSPWCGTSVKHSGFKQFSIVTASSMPVFLSLMKTSKNKGSTFYNICQALLTINNCLLKSWEMSQLLWTLHSWIVLQIVNRWSPCINTVNSFLLTCTAILQRMWRNYWRITFWMSLTFTETTVWRSVPTDSIVIIITDVDSDYY